MEIGQPRRRGTEIQGYHSSMQHVFRRTKRSKIFGTLWYTLVPFGTLWLLQNKAARNIFSEIAAVYLNAKDAVAS